ncbi:MULTISPECIES: DEAD/DEAH box helicase [unclassified Tenacibaculum]|uniref:DEAD/DEAH box helicase n=1 Tax=unclassified Tenacibaculum TaxID=2635139 RepID=UPI001F1C6154|nr:MULTISPECIES: DEAD/DEAH box helicase [unclassified Tenacibaculum]MCF2875936.1 DEAD/DEAH box helicase [Tenacibaculum sp. Cn5-1]MCF2936011.1 DEAD/DEAH box helicase [Tenacibaculum sp. Cn5-34]MCG7512572.1 DEAD/DEAH box helicase [Tenacibaculum sp. Cn5-46]
MQFSDLQLNKSIVKALTEERYHKPTLVQEKAIPIILEKKDVIVAAQTGTGKTAAFALPIIHHLAKEPDAEKRAKKIKALIVSPTRELAIQIEENFKTYSKYTNLRTTAIYGGVSIKPQKELLAKGVDILIATPGRFIDLHKQGDIDLRILKTFVLDEADLMLDMGFIHDVKKIEELCPRKKQTLLFSATMPEKVTQLASSMLYKPETVSVTPSESTSNNIGQLLYYTPKKNKVDLCLHLLRNTINGRIIIFRRTKFGVDKLEKTLLKNGYKATSVHGDKSQALRNEAIENFKNNKVNILIATDVAARGIDISKIDAVINVDLPNIPETYVHRIGRTGRAGKSGIAFSLCSADETSYIKAIQEFIGRSIKIVEDHPFALQKPKKKKQPNTISKHKKGRKSEASKKRKKRWY